MYVQSNNKRQQCGKIFRKRSNGCTDQLIESNIHGTDLIVWKEMMWKLIFKARLLV